MLLALRGEVGQLRQEGSNGTFPPWFGAWAPAAQHGPVPLPSPHWSLSPSLGFHGDQEADSSVEEEAVSKATCYCTNWLGLESSGYQGRGLGQRGGLLGFPSPEPSPPGRWSALGLAVMERVVATTTSMRSTEKGLNCLSSLRMNSCFRRYPLCPLNSNSAMFCCIGRSGGMRGHSEEVEPGSTLRLFPMLSSLACLGNGDIWVDHEGETFSCPIPGPWGYLASQEGSPQPRVSKEQWHDWATNLQWTWDGCHRCFQKHSQTEQLEPVPALVACVCSDR